MNSLGQIYDFDYNFSRSQGSAIVLKKEGLAFEAVSDVQWNMMRMGNIPGLLPLHLEELDFEVQFTYMFSGKKMLSKALQGRAWTQEECFHWLLQLVTILTNSSKYMLTPWNYILHSDFVFIDNVDRSASLIYLPIQTKLHEEPIQRQLKLLLLDMMEHMRDWNGETVQQWIKLLQNEDLSLIEIRRQMLQLVEQGGDSVHLREKEEPSPFFFEDEESELDGQRTEAHFAQDEPADADLKERFNWRYAAYGGAVLLSAIVWRLYLLRSEPLMLYVALAITVLLFGATYGLDKWLKRKQDKPEPGHEPEEPPPLNPWWNEEPIQRYSAVQWPEAAATLEDSKSDSDSAYSEDDPSHSMLTELVAHEETTVVFEDELVTQKVDPWIEIQEDGNKTEYKLNQSRFVFGRDKETAHYVTASKHASRQHFEITKNGENYALMDLGSRNGTFLNKEAIAPYKPYILQPNDEIRVMETVVLYRVSGAHNRAH